MRPLRIGRDTRIENRVPLSSPAGILMTVEPIKREGVQKGT